MGRGLTGRQGAALEIVRESLARRGMPPTVREVAAALGIAAPTALAHLRALERKGFLRRDARKSRSIELLGPSGARADVAARSIPIVGSVAAGSPALSEADVEGWLPVAAQLVGDGVAFALRVRGESMRDAGILDGDLVVARLQETARDGEIVVALVDGESTVKRLRRRAGRWRLEPANPEYRPVPAGVETKIQGKVVAVFRRL